MVRTLPFRMHRKECEFLVEAAHQYFEGTKSVGCSVTTIWSMCDYLKTQLETCSDIKSAVLTILNFQKNQPID